MNFPTRAHCEKANVVLIAPLGRAIKGIPSAFLTNLDCDSFLLGRSKKSTTKASKAAASSAEGVMFGRLSHD